MRWYWRNPDRGQLEGLIPDLRGERVMVFPVQIRAGVPGDASSEIDFALRTRSSEVEWIFSDELESVLARAPGTDSSVTGDLVRGRVGGTGIGRFGRRGAHRNVVVLHAVRSRVTYSKSWRMRRVT